MAKAQGPNFDQLKSDILNASTEKRKIEGLINLGINLGRTSNDSLQFYYNSLSSKDFDSPDLVIAGQVFLKAIEKQEQNDLESAIVLFEESQRLFETLDVPNLYYRCRNFLGIAYTRVRDYENALAIFQGTIDKVNAEGAKVSHLRAAHANLINVYRRVRDFASAIYHTEMLISFAEEGSMNRSLAFSYLNMTQMLIELQYYERAIDAANKIDYDFLSGSMPLVIDKSKGLSFQNIKVYDSAIYYFERSLTYEGANINPDLKFRSKVALIKLYTAAQQFEKIPAMIESFEKQMDSNQPIPLQTNYAIALMDYYLAIEDQDAALNVGLELEAVLSQKDALAMSQDIFLKIANIYEEQDKTALAYKYNKLYTDLEITRIEAQRTIGIQEARAQLAEMEADRRVNEAENDTVFYQRLNTIQMIILIALLFSCIVIYFYYRRERNAKIYREDELFELQKELEELSKREKSNEIQFLKLKSHGLIQLSKIKYIQSDGPYLELFEDGKERPEIDRNTLKSVLTELPENFIQVHRSFIVNIQYIKSIYSNKLKLKDGTEINISRSFKPNVELALRASA